MDDEDGAFYDFVFKYWYIIARTENLDAKNFRILVRRITIYSSFHVLNIHNAVSAFPVHAIVKNRLYFITLSLKGGFLCQVMPSSMK